MKSRKGTAYEARPTACLLIKAGKVTLQLGGRECIRASARQPHRRPIEGACPNRQSIVFSEKSRLICRIQYGKNGDPIGIGLKVLRAKIQKHRFVAQPEEARVVKKIGFHIAHSLLGVRNGSTRGYKIPVNLL